MSYDDRPVEQSGFDKFMSHIATLIIGAAVSLLCCPIVGVLGLVGMIVCKNPDAKRNSIIILVCGVIGFVISLVVNFLVLPGMMAGMEQGMR